MVHSRTDTGRQTALVNVLTRNADRGTGYLRLNAFSLRDQYTVMYAIANIIADIGCRYCVHQCGLITICEMHVKSGKEIRY